MNEIVSNLENGSNDISNINDKYNTNSFENSRIIKNEEKRGK